MGIKFSSSLLLIGLLFTGCDNISENHDKFELSNTNNKTYMLNKQNGELFYIDNKTMYKVVTESNTENKVGEILNQSLTFDYTKINIKTKIYNDSIYYTAELLYFPKYIDVVDDTDSTKKIRKDVSEITYEDWKKLITSYDKSYSVTLVFKDKDNFTITSKEILLKNYSVNTTMGVMYEGSFAIDKSYATKINTLINYYYIPETIAELKKNKF